MLREADVCLLLKTSSFASSTLLQSRGKQKQQLQVILTGITQFNRILNEENGVSLVVLSGKTGF